MLIMDVDFWMAWQTSRFAIRLEGKNGLQSNRLTASLSIKRIIEEEGMFCCRSDSRNNACFFQGCKASVLLLTQLSVLGKAQVH